MKKTMKIVMLFCLVLLACTIVFTACDKGEEQQTQKIDSENVTPGGTDNPGSNENPGGESHVHSYGEWTVLKASTCTEQGEQERVCECGEKETQTISALGHTEAVDAKVDPTCVSSGLTEGKHCSVCNEVLEAQKTVDALGHTAGDWVVTKKETATEDGMKQKSCTVCSEVLESVVVPAIGSIGLEYSVNKDGVSCIVTGMGTCTDLALYIPSVINGYTVTAIGGNAFTFENITKLVVPGSVKVIGESAFWYCSDLRSITLSEGVVCIEADAFSSCENLEKIVLAESVTDIAYSAFSDCNKLVMQEYSNAYYLGTADNPYYALIMPKDNNITSVTVHSECRIIVNLALSRCRQLTELNLGEKLTHIGYGAFEYCDNLKSLTIPNSVVSVAESAFYNCSGLTNLTIGSGLTRIGERAFESCSSLASIIIPENVTEIGYRAFARCSKLTTVKLPNSISVIGEGAFAENSKLMYTKLQNGYYLGNDSNSFLALMEVSSSQSSFEIHQNCKVIGGGAFSNYSYLKSINIPNGIRSIGDEAFAYCTKLETITIPDSVKYIGSNAFQNCVKLTKITLPNGIVSINDSAFYKCTGLVEITIPDSVVAIGNNAFEECSSLTGINIPDNVTKIGESAFYYCTSLSNVSLPSQLVIISEYAFNNCSKLTEVVLPDGVKYVGTSAFADCRSLTKVSIPNSVVFVSNDAFSYCNNLSYSKYDIGYYLGNDANPYVVLMYSEGWEANSLTVHHDCRIIVENVFEYYNIENITLPKQLIYIGGNAFSGINTLKSLKYEGNEEQWRLLLARCSYGNDCLSTDNVQFNCNY